MSMKTVIGIVAALIVTGVGGTISMAYSGARESGATEVELGELKARVTAHDARLEETSKEQTKVAVSLERIEERTKAMQRELERIVEKLDEEPRRGRTGR